jgi:hypothetical protein
MRVGAFEGWAGEAWLEPCIQGLDVTSKLGYINAL